MTASADFLRVARALQLIREERFVFCGAAILPLLFDDPAAPEARSTKDVDAVVDVSTYSRWERLQNRLRDCGIVTRADVPAGKGRICLFHLGDIDIDIMPVRLSLVVPESRTLQIGFQYAISHRLADDLMVLTLSAPALLAAKLEAFFDRGWRLFPNSKDFEDIVALLDRRLRLSEEVSEAHPEIRAVIAAGARRLSSDPLVLDVITDSIREPVRTKRIFDILKKLSAVDSIV